MCPGGFAKGLMCTHVTIWKNTQIQGDGKLKEYRNKSRKVTLNGIFVLAVILRSSILVFGSDLDLKSDYFKNDAVAQDIASGTITDHTFSGTSPTGIQYRISSAFKMLDYAYKDPFSPSALQTFRIAFQRIHSIPETDFITSEFVILLDGEIYEHEQMIQDFIVDFPIDESFYFDGNYIEYLSHDENEPMKDHVRYFFAFLLGSLPEHIAPLTLETVYYFFRCQSHGIIKHQNSRTVLQYIPGGAVFKRTQLSPSHTHEVVTFFHEYAHQIDSRLYSHFSPHVGMVETLGFYEILFDLDDTKYGPFGIYARHPADPRFVSGYADGWEHPEYPGYYSVVESFAESFALYVVNGRLYRQLATINYEYEQQYNWLKTNVFDGIEYDTGSEDCISNDSPLWDYSSDSPPSTVTDTVKYKYLHDNTNYENPIFSLSRHVERLGAIEEPTYAVTTELLPLHGGYGTKLNISGSGFGNQRSGMFNGSQGYYSFVTFNDDTDTMIATKYSPSGRLWRHSQIVVKFKKLFIDVNGNYLQDSFEPTLDENQVPLGLYLTTFTTIMFNDVNDNGIYDVDDVISDEVSSNSVTFTHTAEPCVWRIGPDPHVEPGEIIRVRGRNLGDGTNSTLRIGPREYTLQHNRLRTWTDQLIKIRVPFTSKDCSWWLGETERKRHIWVTVGPDESNKKSIWVQAPPGCLP